MNFGFTEEQELLRAEVRKFLEQNAPLEQVRRIAESPEGFDRELWKRMAELGWIGIGVPEEHGGLGMGFETLVVVLEETGRTLFPSPLVSTLLAAAGIARAGDAAQRERWLPGLAEGSRIGTLALLEESDDLEPRGIALSGRRRDDGWELTGRKLFVPDAGAADLFLVPFRTGEAPGDVAVAVLERGDPGVSSAEQPGMDATRRTGRLELDHARVGDDRLLGAQGDGAALVSWLVDVGALAVAAEVGGAAEQAVAITAAFAGERVQFGSPIGRFQGVKHPLAEMHVDVESVKSLVYYAAWALDQDAPDAAQAVSRAKAYASEAFPRIGVDGVQLHGGVGYTMEYDIQMYLKRSKWARAAFGDADFHYDRLDRLARSAQPAGAAEAGGAAAGGGA